MSTSLLFLLLIPLCGVINKVSNSFPHVTSLRTLTCISVRLHQALRMSKEGDVSPFALSDLDVDTPDSKFDESNASFFKSDLRSYEESLKELERKIEKTNFSKSMVKESEASMISLEKRIKQALSLTLDQRTEFFSKQGRLR